MCPTIVSLMVTGDAPVSYWPFSPLSLITVPEIFAKINSIHPLVSKAAKSVPTPLFLSDYNGQH